MMTPEQIREWIIEAMDAEVEIEGDGQHFFATIVSPEFTGKSRIQRHQLVYRALGSRVGNEIHALSMKTLSPDEAAS
ncbi:BolA/IbaG family iron-sulfur metabolism protein [Gammaproteobacteria bacterium]|nr:BolA/IbaG family iron-sulfur metabolism protein [Gammaproteobacteria bacterium]